MSTGIHTGAKAESPPPDLVRPIVRVVDDDLSFLRAVSRRLRAAGFSVEEFDSIRAFRARRTDSPGCVLLDLRLPSGSGLDIQESLLSSPEPLPVIFLSGQADVQSSVAAMKRGAVDFLSKPVPGDELIAAVRRAIDLDAAARARRQRARELFARYRLLTPREREVFALVADGLPNRDIAAKLGVTARTVKAHRAKVATKMRARSVAALAVAATSLGVTSDSARHGGALHP